MADSFDLSALTEAERIELAMLLEPAPMPALPVFQDGTPDFAAFAAEATRETAERTADPAVFLAQAAAHDDARDRHLAALLAERDRAIGWRLPPRAPDFLELWHHAGELAAADGVPEPSAEAAVEPVPELPPTEAAELQPFSSRL